MPKPRTEERAGPLVKEKRKLDLVHERFDYAVDRWKQIREERKTDMRHVAGDPWEPKEKLARQQAMRPTPACDELGQYENQVVNEVRANPRAIRFSPVGFGANDTTATFYGDKTREIEYRSKAQQHYTRAFQNMVEGSYGYVKVRTEYVTDIPGSPTKPWSAFNKRLVIEGVPDPDVIYPDPDFLDATGRDWDWLFEIEKQTIKEFKKNFPGAEIQNFSPELVKYADGWITGTGQRQTLQIASYWEVEKTLKTLNAWEVRNTQSGAQEVYELFDDDTEMASRIRKFGAELVDKREVEDRTVWQYRTNGVEILKKTEWVGRTIPYAAFFGKMLWLDLGNGPQLIIQSMTRLARVPNMLLAYYLACEAEIIGKTPKMVMRILKGTLDAKNARKLAMANHTPVPYVEFNSINDVTGQPNTGEGALGIQDQFEPPIQAIEIAKESARRAIQAAMGMTPLPTSAQKRNEKSGVALRQIEESGQRGSYHFIDSYDMGIARIGEILEDCIPKVHDTAGETPVLDNQKRPQNVFINAGLLPQGHQAPEDAIASIEGLHAVTIDVGPDFASERAQASDFVDTFVASSIFQALPPPMAMEILALLIKLKNLGPIGEEIADILHPNDEEEQKVPVAKLQEVVQMGEQMKQALLGKIEELTREKEAKVVELEGKRVIAAEQDATKRDIAAAEIDKDRDIAKLKADIEMLKLHIGTVQQDKQTEAQMATTGAQLAQSTAMTEREHEETSVEAARERESRAQEARENRESADRNAAEDRKIKAQAAKAPKGGAK